jgi:hypothetical protein
MNMVKSMQITSSEPLELFRAVFFMCTLVDEVGTVHAKSETGFDIPDLS